MRLRGRTSAFGLAVVLATATAMADTVVTAREVIAGSIQTADSSFVRLKMPGGGIRMLVTSDVYELRFSDPGRIEDFSILLPKVKVVLDSGQPIAFRAQGTSGLEPQPVDSVGAARRRELEREGFSRGILSAPLQAVAASGGGSSGDIIKDSWVKREARVSNRSVQDSRFWISVCRLHSQAQTTRST